MSEKNTNLFGDSIAEKESPLSKKLKKYDQESFEERLSRLKYLDKIFPKNYGFMLPPETFYLFQEAKMSFINGQYVATIMLTQAFIEHVLQSFLTQIAENRVSRKGLKAIIEWFKDKFPQYNYLMYAIEELRLFRNPFSHLRPNDDNNRISQLAMNNQVHPDEILLAKTKNALELMYQISITKFKT